MKKIASFAIALGLGAVAPQAAYAARLTSIYTETKTCPLMHDEVEDFIRECHGPGGVRAVLQYFDGLFGVFYLPMGGDRPMEREDMFDVARNAASPHGAKHEWRMRQGDTRPCAAIIRTYTTSGQYLVVTELIGGERLGVVRTNDQARVLSDRACNSPTAPSSTVGSPPPSVAREATLPSSSVPPVDPVADQPLGGDLPSEGVMPPSDNPRPALKSVFDFSK